jgi:hypothetical protein
MGREQALPMARPASEFIVEELADEVLVYDQVSHQAHCLPMMAAQIWRMCDGVTSRGAAEKRLAGTMSLDAVLEQLTRTGLVCAPRRPRERINRTRRAMFSKTAIVAAAVIASPIVYSIVAPSVAEAASVCGGHGQPCCATPQECVAGPKTCLSGICS